MSKRVGTPRRPIKSGIKFQWGRLEGELDYLLLFTDVPPCDRALVMQHFTSTKCSHDHINNKAVFEPSFIDELEQRGYDTKTLRFSVEKYNKEGENNE